MATDPRDPSESPPAKRLPSYEEEVRRKQDEDDADRPDSIGDGEDGNYPTEGSE